MSIASNLRILDLEKNKKLKAIKARGGRLESDNLEPGLTM